MINQLVKPAPKAGQKRTVPLIDSDDEEDDDHKWNCPTTCPYIANGSPYAMKEIMNTKFPAEITYSPSDVTGVS
jgi:hypothetical protein